MDNKTNTGTGFFGLLGIVFIVLRLTHTIDWAWVWVLAPIWMPAAILLIIVLVLTGVVLYNKRNRK